MYVCIYTSMYACIYTCMDVCILVCPCICVCQLCFLSVSDGRGAAVAEECKFIPRAVAVYIMLDDILQLMHIEGVALS